MTPKTIFTHKKMSLDINVWLVMLVTVLLCLGLIGYKKINNKPCTPFTINVRSLTNEGNRIFQPGEVLTFKTSLSAEKKVTWKFSDKPGKEISLGNYIHHEFLQPGLFTVTATTNGDCFDEITVNIKKSEISPIPPDPPTPVDTTNPVDTTRTVVPPKTLEIYGKTSTITGKQERYFSNVIANSYEWKIIGNPRFRTINDTAVFTFGKAGKYTLELEIDHDRKKRAQLKIIVSKRKPIPPIPTPKLPEIEPPRDTIIGPSPDRKIQYIQDESFKTRLDGVGLGQFDVSDFDQFLVNKGETKVLVNYESNYKTFKQLCQGIREGEIIIESVELKRDKSDKTKVLQILVNF